MRTPADAAEALDLSLPRYYLWEQRALEGLVRACEPRAKGQAAHERYQMAVLEKEVGRLRLDCARQQALVRASQRTMSLAACGPPTRKPPIKAGPKAAAKTADGGKAKRKRRPVARALKAVAALQAPLGEEIVVDSPPPASVRGRKWYNGVCPVVPWQRRASRRRRRATWPCRKLRFTEEKEP